MKPTIPLYRVAPRPNTRLDPHEQPLREMPEIRQAPFDGVIVLLLIVLSWAMMAALIWWVWP